MLAIASLACSPAPAAEMASVNPAADAFVAAGPDGSLSGNNYGAAGSLALSASSSARGEFQSVLKFDLSSIATAFDAAYGPGMWTAQSATLQLTASNPSNGLFNANAAGSFTVRLMQSQRRPARC